MKYLLILYLPFLYITYVSAVIINVDSCEQEVIQGAINSSNDGDIVLLPIDSCTWYSPVVISNKELILQGNGIDQSIIIKNRVYYGLYLG